MSHLAGWVAGRAVSLLVLGLTLALGTAVAMPTEHDVFSSGPTPTEAASQADLDTDLAKQVLHSNRYQVQPGTVALEASAADAVLAQKALHKEAWQTEASFAERAEQEALGAMLAGYHLERQQTAQAAPAPGTTEQQVFQLLQLQGGSTWGGPFVPTPAP